MKCKFLGGAEEVGKLSMVACDGSNRLMFDHGFLPTRPPTYPLPAPEVDAAFITHGHVDHSGLVPVLTEFEGCRLFGTSPTISTSLLLMEDSIKVGESQGHRVPFGKAEVKAADERYEAVYFGETVEVKGSEVRCHDAGHIPGATMYELVADKTTLFTGDLNTIETELVHGAKPVKCDNLIIEGTYAGRNHPDRQKTVKRLIMKIEDVLDRGGVAVLPAFAVSRSQELVMSLMGTGFDICLDGLGKTVNKIYLGENDYIKSPKRLRKALYRARPVRNFAARQKALKSDVIVTTSGMLDGGPALWYLSKLYDNPHNAILLTGYQVEGSNGRRLVETGTLEIAGNMVRVECEVDKFDLSAHAGHDEIVKFIDRCEPRKVVLMHSDDPTPIADEIGERYEVIIPKNGVEFEL